MNIFVVLFNNFIELFIDSAPWLLLGLVIAGMIKAFIPSDLMAQHLGANSIGSVIKAALFGAPLPLCSCGVIPAALGLRQNGASPAATTAFLISTPETGVDSVSISYALLGPFVAVIRPIAAIVTAITAGVAVIFFNRNLNATFFNHVPRETCCENDTVSSSCCADTSLETIKQSSSCRQTKTTVESVRENTIDCCSQKPDNKNNSIISRLLAGLHYTLFDLVKDITAWLLLGLFAASMILTFIPTSFLSTWGSSVYAFVIMAAIGIPMYICATASTPIAAGLLVAGVSPGAVLVFLLVGPATNLATLGVVQQNLGRRVLTIYLSSVVIIGFIFGYMTNLLATHFYIDISAQTQHAHTMVNPHISTISSILLAGFMCYALLQKLLLRAK